jgi:hypothetical protein
MSRFNNKAADVQGLVANKARTVNSIKKISYDGENLVGTYDPKTQVMLGGYSSDGETFDNDFKITEVEEANVQDALRFCAGMYGDYGTINMSFSELKEIYEEDSRREAILHSCEE